MDQKSMTENSDRDHERTGATQTTDCAAPSKPAADELGPFQAGSSDLCDVVADVDGSEQHQCPVPAQEGTASTAGMPKRLPESGRLSVRTLALLHHKASVWSAHARGRAWCLRFGMTASSWDGWAKMHVNPFVAMRFYFLSQAYSMLVKAYLVTALPMNKSMVSYIVTVPYMLHIPLLASMGFTMFRFGPQVAFHWAHVGGALLMVLLILPMWYVGYIGPLKTVPWNNRFKFLVVNFMIAISDHLITAAGGLPGEHPEEPRTSIVKPVLRAIIQTFRVTDSLTDLSLIGELIAERRDGCWMFGVPGRCGAWNWLIGMFCLFAAFDFIVALGTSVSGRESMDSPAKKRTYLACQCTALVCELGIVVCTLVHFFNLRHPGNSAREGFSLSQQRSSIGLTFASLATTLLTFMFTMVGISKALAAARSAVASVSRRTSARTSKVAPRAAHAAAQVPS